MPDLEFDRHLYRGTAEYYERFRVPYPKELTDDLARRSGADGSGTLLDLGCGTGQITFALHDRFGEVWALDQEPEMVEVVRQKAAAAGITNIRPVVAAAEDSSAPPGSVDLVAVGNAFHRMPRRAVAATVLRSLRPGGHLALLWGGDPHSGGAAWQQAVIATMARWRIRADTVDRVPADYERERAEAPDSVVLSDSGFEPMGRHIFPASRGWTPDEVVGFVYSTSVLSRAALGELTSAFETDMRRELAACEPSGRLHQVTEFAYDLFRAGTPVSAARPTRSVQ